jgi:hypothetical protein
VQKPNAQSQWIALTNAGAKSSRISQALQAKHPLLVIKEDASGATSTQHEQLDATGFQSIDGMINLNQKQPSFAHLGSACGNKDEYSSTIQT